MQITESFQVYGKHVSLNYSVILGGVSQGPQVAACADASTSSWPRPAASSTS